MPQVQAVAAARALHFGAYATMAARNPSGTNRITLCGAELWVQAVGAVAISNTAVALVDNAVDKMRVIPELACGS